MQTPISAALCLTAGLALAPVLAAAQAAPQAGDLLRELERQPAQPLPSTLPSAAPRPAGSDNAAGPRIDVTGFRIAGARLIPEADLQAAVAPWVGQSASFADLRRAADAIAEAYRARGLLARTWLPDQDLAGGVVTVNVIEAMLGAVRIDRPEGATRLGDDRAQGFITARQKVGDPVRPDDLQRGISLLNDLPGVSATSLLEPGEAEGESRVVVAVKDKPVLAGMFTADNSGAKASGEARASLGGYVNNALGQGEQLQLLVNKSAGTRFGRAAASLPLGSDGLRANVNASRLDYGYTLSGSRYTGSANVAGAGLSYPLLRGLRGNLSATLDHDRKRFDNAVAGIGLSDKTVRLTTFALAGDRLDDLLGGGLVQASVAFAFGRLDLAGNAGDLANDQVANGPGRNGSFSRVSWTLTRLQRITDADTLAINAAGQFSNRNLDASEKFVATGTYGVRAYTSSEPGADDATVVGLELRHQFGDLVTASVFHDRAQLRRDHVVNSASALPNSYRLAGSGLGLSVGRASDVLVRATLAWRNGDNPARSPATGLDADGTRRSPRFFVSLVKTF
ncbi:ShlB/FhaC/HecB family hemolysin secretion/activation protein [Derxia lacustris]|uniref:ShlB/FhaC/HecB family hemolysin secretion/activation protein n=1 Tax=Derxia lacustris TaxID=764842 RepID=UPI000A174176|nr:ShlB/FhaC/HecB family hemolysin secretion/activation protein [Derxia lacustris]